MFLFNAFGVAHGGVAAVLHRSVAADVTDGGVAAVLHGPVAADIADGGMIAVLHRAVVADIADGGVTAVLHRSVVADVSDGGVVAVVHCAVIHVGCGCVVAVLYGLCRYVCGDGKQECQCQKFGEGFHNRRFLGSTLSFVCIAKISFFVFRCKRFFHKSYRDLPNLRNVLLCRGLSPPFALSSKIGC